jgi:hypothetical protein
MDGQFLLTRNNLTMAKFKKGELVKFNTPPISSDSAPISAVVDNPSGQSDQQQYIVLNNVGWKPTQELISKYGLNASSKYVFLFENQLTKL